MHDPSICAEYSTHITEKQPVGPCVLRPGHLGRIHQDMRGVQWATRPDSTPSRSATCPNGPTGEHQYNEGKGSAESRTCDHCGAGGCCVPGAPVEYCGVLSSSIFGEAPAECVLRPGHSARHSDNRGGRWWHTPDEAVTGSDSVDELRARLHAAIRAISRGEQEIVELRRDNTQLLGEQAACIAAEQQRDRVAATLRKVRAELHTRDEALAKQRSACQRALRNVCAVQRMRDLANRWYGQGAPATSYARELLATLDNAA
ncbi:hypothetical protein ACIOHC_11270 [Streptomyces sp. NPDC088252]|uniref:hypothetical protein n=1 Tax=unclassified Streptomyces TaxID=2593676 RepID=UPI003800A35B